MSTSWKRIARRAAAAGALCGTLSGEAMAAGIDETIDRAVRPVADLASGFIFYSIPFMGTKLPLIVLWLIGGGLFFTVYLRFVNLRGFRHALKLVAGHYDDPAHPGEISHFQALCTAVSGTVGIGNIAGVAVAISAGGPGATLWLIVAGLLGMSTKFAECTLGVRYRSMGPDGSVSGGPMYYLEHGLAERGLPNAGKALGSFYAASMVVGCLGIGNMFQSNQATAIFIDVTGAAGSPFADRAWVVGLLLAAAVAVVILGGIRSIATTTSRLVPIMAVLYVLSAAAVLALNYRALPASFAAIWNGAFSPEGISGGMLGVLILGFRRAVFSNEAGLGSASIAHATGRTAFPIREGYVALLEPFVDTVVICTMTALVIVSTVYDPALAGSGVGGIEITARAFASQLSWSPIPLSVAAILFAFSTMLAWSYYGLKALTYLTGESRRVAILFNLTFCAFVVLGSSVQLGALVDLSDALVFVVAIPNILGLYLLAPVLGQDLRAYEARRKSPQH